VGDQQSALIMGSPREVLRFAQDVRERGMLKLNILSEAKDLSASFER